MQLSESQQALVDQAHVYYDRYNFYDALSATSRQPLSGNLRGATV